MTVSAAIVGLGSWGRTLVSSAQHGCAELRFTAALSRSPEKVETYCREQGLRLARDFDDLLADATIDALVLATPNSQHAAQVSAAANAGKHVFVEKPVALDYASAKAAVRAAQAAGVVLAVGFNRRFHPSMQMLRQNVQAGRLGALGAIVAELTATTAFYRAPDSWRADPREEPAGAMAAIGVHLVDTMIDLAGRVRRVYCVVAHRAGPHSDDTTSLTLEFESGVMGLAYCSVAAARNYRVAAYGARGYAEVATPTMDVFRFIPAVEGRASHLARIPDAQETVTRDFDTTRAELAQFALAIMTGEAYPVPLEDVLHGMAVFDAAVASAAVGHPMSVADERR